MERLIRDLINFAIGPLATFVTAFRNSVLRLWHLLLGFFGGGWRAWAWVRARYHDWIVAHWYALLSIYDFGRNLVFVRIPRLLADLSRSVTAWAARLIDDVGNLARGLFRQAIDFAARAFNTVRGLLDQFARWATGLIDRLISDVGRLLRRIFDDWATPERLATWIVGAMFRALWRFFLSNVERVSASLWPLRARIIMSTLGLVERILARVL